MSNILNKNGIFYILFSLHREKSVILQSNIEKKGMEKNYKQIVAEQKEEIPVYHCKYQMMIIHTQYI